MIETRRLKNVVIFIQTILNFVLSRNIMTLILRKFDIKGHCKNICETQHVSVDL